MRGPRIDFYNDMESEATESKSYDQGLYEIIFHVRQIARDQRAAGYEQALRDVRDNLRSIEHGMGPKAWAAGWAADHIQNFGYDRGLDLGHCSDHDADSDSM